MNAQTIIDNIGNEESFVLYKLPNTNLVHCIIDPSPLSLQDISELKKIQSGFIFSPFSTSKHPIIVFLKQKAYTFEDNNPVTKDSHSYDVDFNTPSTSYTNEFNTFLSKIQEGCFSKLVLARTKDIFSQPDLVQLFTEACHSYPNAMVYLLKNPHTGAWLGASPEILVEGESSHLHTVALAGTMLQSDLQSSDWTEKNKEEQKIVADHVRDAIKQLGSLKKEEGPYTSNAGHLSHLKSDFYFKLEQEKIPNLIALLHPTPATCGIPQNEALDFILKTEKIDRSYYAGYFGWYEPESTSHLYVNLRCLQKLNSSTIRLYAGGGILPSSNMENEWQETENKLKTLLQLPELANH